LPKGTDASMWFRVAPDGNTTLDITLVMKEETAASDLEKRLRLELEPLFKDRESDVLGKVAVTREKATVRIGGTFTPLLIGMISSAIP
jgi:hypothetical protein